MGFGTYIKECREELLATDPEYSIRKVAKRVGVDPTFLSRLERERQGARSPRPEIIERLAEELAVERDLLFALANRTPPEVEEAMRSRPEILFAIIRELDRMPDGNLERILRTLQKKNEKRGRQR